MSRRRTIRNEILIQLYGHRGNRIGRSAERIARAARHEGETDVTTGEIHQECSYLEGKNLIESRNSEVARDDIGWVITSAGIDYVEEILL